VCPECKEIWESLPPGDDGDDPDRWPALRPRRSTGRWCPASEVLAPLAGAQTTTGGVVVAAETTPVSATPPPCRTPSGSPGTGTKPLTRGT